MNITEAKRWLGWCYDYARDFVSICFLSAPGVGKTQMVEEFARERGVKLIKILCSQMLPSEVAGINVPEGDDFKPLDPWLLKQLKDGDILFFDEWLTAPDSVRNACLTLVKDRELMSNKKLPNIMIVGATNPIPTVSQLTTQQRDRFIWMDVEYNEDAFASYIEQTFHMDHDDCKKFSYGCGFDRSESLAKKYNVWTPRSAERWLRWIQNIGGVRSQYWDTFKRQIGVCYSEYTPSVAIEELLMAPVRREMEEAKAAKQREETMREQENLERVQVLLDTPHDILTEAIEEALVENDERDFNVEVIETETTDEGVKIIRSQKKASAVVRDKPNEYQDMPEFSTLFDDPEFVKEVMDRVKAINASDNA